MFESNGDDEEHADFSDQPSPGGGRDELDDVRLGSTSPSGGGEKNKKKFNFKQFMEKSKETILHNVDQAKKIADRVILETKLTFVGLNCTTSTRFFIVKYSLLNHRAMTWAGMLV